MKHHMLNGKKGLVIGLANEHSIAFAAARMLQAQGAEVIATCLNDKARQYVEPITEPLAMPLVNLNVENEGELEAVIKQAATQLGQIDFVVHSIAFAPLDDLHGPLHASSADGFKRAMDISCHSFIQLAHLVRGHMPNGGALMTMSYLGAHLAVPNYGLMGPVKAALESSVRYLASELGGDNIRVHAISPGPIATRAASGIAHFDELMANVAKRAPLKRLVHQDEVAGLVAFLASDLATGMTGQTLYVDAGEHMVP
jgi:enoyl-[acyl-carrier protein] reductase I